jgi:hypothetical protein
MGYIPLILVLLMTILLWMIVTYNSFIAKKAAAELAGIQQEKQMVKRSENLLNLNTLVKIQHLQLPTELIEAANNPLQARDFQTGWQKLQDLQTLHPDLWQNPDFEKTVKELEAGQKVYQQVQKRYQASVLDYNKQVAEPPSRFIARLFGFQKITV